MRVFYVAALLFILLPGSAPAAASGHLRVYYIAADEVRWNYAPQGRNVTIGRPFDKLEAPYAIGGPHSIGSVYWKAVYRRYTDGTFEHLMPRPPSQQYLGILGPIIHAEVGDTIKVVFKNNATRPYSIHPHGVLYDKASEGDAYDDGSSAKEKIGGAVQPGHTYTYIWHVPDRAGPGPNDPNSIVWLYHSHTDDQKDVDSGLIGAIVVTRKGMARPDGTPKDVDREFVTLFQILNENQSWYLDRNIKDFAPTITAKQRLEFLGIDPQGNASLTGMGFGDGNFKFTINGYIYGNGPKMVMRQGDRVRWYVVDMGDGLNFHTPHWHGNTVLVSGSRTDVLNVAPAQMITADMVPDNPGTWLYHCHVSDHMRAGMSALYEVLPR